MELTFSILAFLGILLSWYTWHVEQYVGKKKNYTATCDITETISCTKAFRSKFGKTFGISNSVFGMFGYTALLILALLGEIQFVFIFSVFACCMSVYLAYAQYFKVKTFCIICTSIYIINILLAAISGYRLFY